MSTMSYDDFKTNYARLVDLFEAVVVEPPPANLVALGAAIIEVGGDLFDANYLDGAQYHALYELEQAIARGKDRPTIVELASICAGMMPRVRPFER